ncbi:MAG: protein-tyrosine phosphatase family protein [Pirellulaceae bacterium]
MGNLVHLFRSFHHQELQFECDERIAGVHEEPPTVSPVTIRYSIPDVLVPPPQLMSEILDHIDRSLQANRPVYVHCWGGIGRTGTVIGCWLLRQGLATRDSVLPTLAQLRQHDMERGHRVSPETEAQRQFVLNWREIAITSASHSTN